MHQACAARGEDRCSISIRHAALLWGRLSLVLLLFGLTLSGATSVPGVVKLESLKDAVILLANADDPESLAIARHYAEKRGVPAENIVALSLPKDETITWADFSARLWNPLADWLFSRQWIDGTRMDAMDSAGRRKYSVNKHRISYLVVCRGVPLRINHDERVRDRPVAMPFAQVPVLQTTEAAVDSELATLAISTRALVSFVPNPRYGVDTVTRWEESLVVKVCRLDGPDFQDALMLVDQAMQAERDGVIGRAYLDYGGPYADGDQWFAQAEQIVAQSGLDMSVDRGPSLMASTDRFDRPILYLGWYAANCTGRMAEAGFRFPPGAIAYHLHSSSASTLRNAGSGWVGPLVSHGVTATFGNVFEPYLPLCQKTQMLVRALLRGDNFGDAAYYSLPGLSWQNLIVGDPLYRPFAVSFAEQWSKRRNWDLDTGAYLVLRRMHLLEADKKPEQALEEGLAEYRERPSLILALGLSERLLHLGRKADALTMLDTVLLRGPAQNLDQARLYLDVALQMKACGNAKGAREVIQQLLKRDSFPEDFKRLLRSILEEFRV